MKLAATVTVIFLVVVAVLHMLRLVFQVEVLVAGMPIPQWVSVMAFVGTSGLAIWLWREQRG